MKRVVVIAISLLLAFYISAVVAYYVATPDKKIARRAFTLGGWKACEVGPNLWDRHMSNISYAYFFLPGSVERYHQSGRGLILTALNVAKCLPDDEWVSFDNSRVKRGIELGLAHEESINEIGGAGVAAVHIAVVAQRLDLLEFLIDKGADINLKSSNDSMFLQDATPLRMARDLESQLELNMGEIIDFLENKLNKSIKPTPGCAAH